MRTLYREGKWWKSENIVFCPTFALQMRFCPTNIRSAYYLWTKKCACGKFDTSKTSKNMCKKWAKNTILTVSVLSDSYVTRMSDFACGKIDTGWNATNIGLPDIFHSWCCWFWKYGFWKFRLACPTKYFFWCFLLPISATHIVKFFGTERAT